MRNNLMRNDRLYRLPGSIRDTSQAMQRVSAVVNSINNQGFEVKELEVDSEKEE